MKPMIYLDNAATTPVHSDVLSAMIPYFCDKYFNPSSRYEDAYDIMDDIKNAKKTLSKTINCLPDEIYFTSGGTESDNWALMYVKPGDHIITSSIEHHAILNKCKYLENCGIEVTYLDVNNVGIISDTDVENAIKDNTKLISIMTINNEIGSVQDISNIGNIAKRHGIVFHTDAVQAYGHIGIDVNKQNIDLLSVSAHKFNGPKGIGFLYVRNGIELPNLIYGGGQQFGKRSGTDNVPGIIGMAKAASIAYENIDFEAKYVSELRDYMQHRIEIEIQNIIINGFDENCNRSSNNLNVCFIGIKGEQLLTLLSMSGIYASTGSACNSSSSEPSYVLKAIGLSDTEANSSIRFTLSSKNTKEEIDYTVNMLKQLVEQLRSL